MTDMGSILSIVRSFDAPRERVWRAWTEPAELIHWWWPERFQTVHEVDLREGGRYRFHSADLPDFGVLAFRGRFLEVNPPERLVYTWQWEYDPESETRVSVEFLDRDRQTELRVLHAGLASPEERDNHVLGWNDCLDRLQTLLTPAKN
ncbi:MAG: SRPBCC domain-containing protein [Chloroflexota bacterium]|nr:SRPBCC domain-containing protein [Chloroflexota bacterium]